MDILVSAVKEHNGSVRIILTMSMRVGAGHVTFRIVLYKRVCIIVEKL